MVCERETCFIRGARRALCCWRRLKGRGETDPPATAACQLRHPVGGRRLHPQLVLEGASGNLPQVSLAPRSCTPCQLLAVPGACASGTLCVCVHTCLWAGHRGRTWHGASCSWGRAEHSTEPWRLACSACVSSRLDPLGTPEPGQDTRSLSIRSKYGKKTPSKRTLQCNPLIQAVHHSHLVFLKDLFQVPVEVYYFTAAVVICFRGSKQKPALLVHTSLGIKPWMCPYSYFIDAPGGWELAAIST